MLREPDSLSDDQTFNIGKVLEISLLLMALTIVSYFYFNSTTNAVAAGKFVILFVIGFLFIIFDYLIKYIKGKQEFSFPDTITHERETMFGELPGWLKKGMLIFVVFISLLIFWQIQASPLYSVVDSHTTFSAVDIGAVNNGIIAFFSAFSEDLFFFGVILPSLFAVLHFFTKHFWFSLLISIVLASLIFMGYHFLVYGTSRVDLQEVFIYGLFSSSYVAIFRNLYALHLIHGFNNLGLVLKAVSG